MNLAFLEEPELEFGAGRRHIDIRFGIMDNGPLDLDQPLAPKRINLGIIGTSESIEGVQHWLEKCRSEIPGKPNKGESGTKKQAHLFTRFPGFNSDQAFCSTLVIDDKLCRPLTTAAIASISRLTDQNERIARSVDLFMEEIQYLSQNTEAKVIICAVPISLLDAMGPLDHDEEDNEEEELDDAELQVTASPLDFHDMLKARAMQQYRKPIQIIRPQTYDPSKHRRESRCGRRTLQDEATRAWNIHTALYYKAGGVPWRLPRLSTELTVCYVGINFYKSLDKQALLTSVAQVFNERGEGVVVRGGTASVSKEDRQPHLPERQAHDLLSEALARYRDVHETYPARVVIHKSSLFDRQEEIGFEAALQEKGIAKSDLISLSPSNTKLFRSGKYPPLRGTLLTLDDREMVLYTRGSVDFFETYPGLYVPNPLRVRIAKADHTQRFLAREILALTKMNWNNTQFDGAEPLTLRASRACSNVLRYCSEVRQIEPRYSFYM